jgi:site-specific recombinase XerD
LIAADRGPIAALAVTQQSFPVHFHMLRHSCGYALANAGADTRAIQDWLGHRSITHTVRYTELSDTFQGLLALISSVTGLGG